MTAIVILAMAMVICLFGGYVDSPDEHAAQPGGATMPKHWFTKPK
jgi:hypothetical protein